MVNESGAAPTATQIAEALINLFLMRKSREDEARELAARLEAEGAEAIIMDLVQREERQVKIRISRFSRGSTPAISLIDLLLWLRDAKADPRILTHVEVEYLFAAGLWQLGVYLHKARDVVELKEQNIRICNIASGLNNVDYVWCVNRAPGSLEDEFRREFASSENLFFYLKDKKWELTPQLLLRQTRNDALLGDCYLYDLWQDFDFYTSDAISQRISTMCRIKHMPVYFEKKICAIADQILFGEGVAPDSRDDPETPVFVSGFAYSGSSAIFDALKGAPECVDPFMGSHLPYRRYPWSSIETPFYRGRGSLIEVYRELEGSEAAYKKKLLGFVVIKLLGSYVTWDFTNAWLMCDCNIFSTFFSDCGKLDAYLDLVATFVKNLVFAFRSREKQSLYRRAVLNLLVDLGRLTSGGSSRYILFDNGFNGWESKYAEALPEKSILVSVYRDPRDHYNSSKKFFKFTPEQYIEKTRSAMNEVFEHSRMCADLFRFIPVSYEHFVLDADYRQQLGDKLGIVIPSKSRSFDPEYSKTRIGRHVEYGNQDEIAQVAAAFPDLMDKSFLKKFPENFLL